MRLFCVDIGNTSAHCGLLENGVVMKTEDLPTGLLREQPGKLEPLLHAWKPWESLVFSSVAPAASGAFTGWMEQHFPEIRLFPFHKGTLPDGFGIDYPRPEEIGGDRLANSCAAFFRYGTPAIVVGMGTATALDVVTPQGYAGGIIAPGLALMADYLHEKTALLPRLDRFDLEAPGAWGKSTEEAMKIGARFGYEGLILSLIKRVQPELERLTGASPVIILTGGNAFLFDAESFPSWHREPHLALLGLWEAYTRYRCRTA